MGIRDPVESAQAVYLASKESTAKIVSAIKGHKFSVQEHKETVVKAHAILHKEQIERDQRKLDAALEPMDAVKRHAILRADDGKR